MRFHFGVSFRLRNLKKFLFPILIGILTYFGLGGLFGCLPVYAYMNTNTFYTFKVFEEDFSQQFYQDKTYQEVLDYYSNFDSDYFNIIVWYNHDKDEIHLNLFPKNHVLYKSVGANSTSLWINGNAAYINGYDINLFARTDSVFINDFISNVDNCLSNNVCPTSYIGNQFGQFSKVTTDQGVDRRLLTFEPISIENDRSYTLFNYQIFNWVYYSQVPFYLRYTDFSDYYYIKYLNINNNTYANDSIFPSYIDLYGSQSLNKDFDSIDKIYLSSIDKSNISNLKLNIKFTFDDFNYIDSLKPNIQYYGRVNHNNSYFTYENIICNSSNLYDYSINNNKYSGSLFNNNLLCTSDLTNYDKIYIYIEFLGKGNHLIQDLKITSNYGLLKTFNSTIGNFQIYEKFENLDYNYSFVLSSLSYESLVYYLSTNEYTILSPINKNDNINNQGQYNPLKFGLFNSTNAFIYNLPNVDNSNYSIELFFTDDVLLSLSNDNNHVLYDDSNNLTNDNIIKNSNVDNNSDYDIIYYIQQVTDFIDDLSLSTNKFGLLVQNLYDSLPFIFKSFIFVVFILFCLKFTLDLIRK